jgi:lipopolysaccharide transport system ATP-binding protein
MSSDALATDSPPGSLRGTSIAIDVQNLSKRYQVYARPHHRLVQSVLRHRLTLYREFWALRNVGFAVEQGESIGIVGRNGSGKSTLLQIIAGTLASTAGEVDVKGRTAAVLALGSDFNPQFTGRENVYLNGAVLGFSRDEVDQRFESIAAFADIGDFIDEPVSVYSNGMVIRLAFSVATCFEPDVLIIDEALAVGDAPFQAKCFARMRGMRDNGVTVLFASHSLATVRAICTKVAYLKEGHLVAYGDTNEVTRQYELDCIRAQGVDVDPVVQMARHLDSSVVSPDAGHSLDQHDRAIFDDLVRQSTAFSVRAIGKRTGTGSARIEAAGFYTEEGTPAPEITHDQRIIVAGLIRACGDIEHDVHIAVRVKTVDGAERLVVRDSGFRDSLLLRSGERVLAKMEVHLPVCAGDYYIEMGVLLFAKGTKYEGQRFNFAGAEVADLVEESAFVHVRSFAWHPIVAPVLAESKLRLRRIV